MKIEDKKQISCGPRVRGLKQKGDFELTTHRSAGRQSGDRGAALSQQANDAPEVAPALVPLEETSGSVAGEAESGTGTTGEEPAGSFLVRGSEGAGSLLGDGPAEKAGEGGPGREQALLGEGTFAPKSRLSLRRNC